MFRFELLLRGLAINIWVVAGFLLWQVVHWALTHLRETCVGPTIDRLFPFVYRLAFLAIWLSVGLLLIWRWQRWRPRFVWLAGGDWFQYGNTDRTGTFATLAGFALAQGVALTAVAKGQERDILVIIIYFVIVVFSYFWARQVLHSGSQGGTPTNSFDSTTVEQGRYTLVWIVFLSSIMITLGFYGLLPNQQYRASYSRTGIIACSTQDAGDYATKPDARVQAQRAWTKWAAASQGDQASAYWIEMATGFDGDFQSFDVQLQALERFKVLDMVAFLVHQDSPAKMPSYRQLPVQSIGTAVNKAWMVTVTEPNTNDRIAVLCRAIDSKTNVITQETIDPLNSFWLKPLLENGLSK